LGRQFSDRFFGADTHSSDPISSFALEREDYSELADAIAALGVPTLVLMEGAGAVGDLGLNVAAFLSGFYPAPLRSKRRRLFFNPG
jgi:acetoin utilization deacetylase AcuC-like enzyme